jgi:membrane protein DedA with SNARE-associated domain
MEAWIVRRGMLAIILGRLIPGLRVPTTVMCGLAGIPYRVYAPSAALAGLIWSALYFLLGALLQRRMGLLASYAVGLLDTIGDSSLATALVISLLVVLIFGGWSFFRGWRARRAERAGQSAIATEPPTRP